MTPDLSRLRWRTSSYSGSNGGSCVELAWETTVFVRDSKNPEGGVLELDKGTFAKFTDAVKHGSFTA
jgi:hypothetical protein